MLIAVLVVLAGIVAVAIGRGGELSQEPPDYAPLDMGPVSATDVVLLRPPTALWGYNMQVTDEAMERIATAIRERDVRIVALEQRLADMAGAERYALTPSNARHARRLPPPALDSPTLDSTQFELGPPPSAPPASEASSASEAALSEQLSSDAVSETSTSSMSGMSPQDDAISDDETAPLDTAVSRADTAPQDAVAPATDADSAPDPDPAPSADTAPESDGDGATEPHAAFDSKSGGGLKPSDKDSSADDRDE